MLKDKLKENSVVLTIRMPAKLYNQLVSAINDNPILYGSKSHFGCVATIRELRRLEHKVVINEVKKQKK